MIFRNWDVAYRSVPPWDVGEPQPAFVRLVEDGELRPGRVLDAGCGTGENALLLARSGCEVTGIDLAEDAIAQAGEKAAERGVSVTFIVGNALELDRLFGEGTFDAAIDSGLFHVMADEERPVLARQVHRVLKPGGSYFMMCFSDREPGKWGPRRVSVPEIERTFAPLFRINYIRDAYFLSWAEDRKPKAYLMSATKMSVTRSAPKT